eukprot:3771713-Amphidinium_carterae.1
MLLYLHVACGGLHCCEPWFSEGGNISRQKCKCSQCSVWKALFFSGAIHASIELFHCCAFEASERMEGISGCVHRREQLVIWKPLHVLRQALTLKQDQVFDGGPVGTCAPGSAACSNLGLWGN